ncbi:MAG: aminoacyl-tRNA hydrolase [Endomicrobiales bacterium]|nr:aminoacyl-tRNA hydrolase [Endomicrobiales bacterium]
MTQIKAIVGLGNPGAKYEKTRHNIGFVVLDLFAQKNNLSWQDWFDVAQVARLGSIVLIKPVTFMNNSGLAVKKVLKDFSLTPSELLVLTDDFAINLGNIRFRSCGSAGGHNGLSSIIDHLSTTEFSRLRIGIGPLPLNCDPVDFVLGKFMQSEYENLHKVAEISCKTIECSIEFGTQKAANLLSQLLNDNNNKEAN